MAAQNLPSLGFFVVRETGAPMNLANAFCTPARPAKDAGLIEGSVRNSQTIGDATPALTELTESPRPRSSASTELSTPARSVKPFR
jgi:hypothetical protein